MKLNYIACVIFLFFLSCFPSGKSDSEFPIIDIKEGLGSFQVSKLSAFASSIRYVQLETKDDCLVTDRIVNIYLEDDKIFVHDDEPYLKVFDARTGKYLYNVGAKGQGPGELPYMYTVDINPNDHKILLCCGEIIHQFDFGGNFLGKIESPVIGEDERINAPVVSIDKHHFAGTVRTFIDNQDNSVILFNDNKEITGSLKCHENPIQHPKIKSWSPLDQGGLFYRVKQEIRYYRGFTDTIYTYNKEKALFTPFFVIDYGKYKSTLKFSPGEENPDLIKVSSIKESNRYIFLNFETKNASPEPYEDEINFDGNLRKFINHSIFGIFDKQKRSFHFLLQPIRGIPGLENDIDKGLPFFVRSVSSKNQLVDFRQAYKFLEYTEALPELNGAFAELVNKISEEDNPIVIIADELDSQFR